MQKVYLISTCILKKKKCSVFHFKGYFKGEKIKEIYINDLNFELNSEYLIKLKVLGIKNGIVFGESLKSKVL